MTRGWPILHEKGAKPQTLEKCPQCSLWILIAADTQAECDRFVAEQLARHVAEMHQDSSHA